MTKKKTTRTGNKNKVNVITWLDHCSWEHNEWHELEQTKALVPLEVTTVGWVVAETKHHLVIAATVTENSHTNGEMCIIKGCITKRTYL